MSTESTPTSTPTTQAAPFAWFQQLPVMGAMGDAWRRAMGDHVARTQAVADQLAAVSAQGAAHTRTMIDESARLMHDSVAYMTTLQQEWQRLAVDTVRTMTGGAQK
ncbi:MAG: hypothetical protein JNK72_20920 [Myxococcales bacterium]|nr:hypothetical protein [Myxococcales bacterium]